MYFCRFSVEDLDNQKVAGFINWVGETSGTMIDSANSSSAITEYQTEARGSKTAGCSISMKKQLDKPGERCSITSAGNHVEQKVPSPVTSGELDAIVYS